jgi:hypothetical protein
MVIRLHGICALALHEIVETKIGRSRRRLRVNILSRLQVHRAMKWQELRPLSHISTGPSATCTRSASFLAAMMGAKPV